MTIQQATRRTARITTTDGASVVDTDAGAIDRAIEHAQRLYRATGDPRHFVRSPFPAVRALAAAPARAGVAA